MINMQIRFNNLKGQRNLDKFFIDEKGLEM